MSLNYSRQGKHRRLWRLAVATQPTIAENWYKVTYYRCVSIPSGRLPLPILQNAALIVVNQPLANSCLVIQNQRGTKTGQNHGKIKSRTLCPKYPLWNTSVSFAKVQICPLKNEGKSLFLSFTTHFLPLYPKCGYCKRF